MLFCGLGRQMRGLVECLCCMVVIGPIMIVIGIIFLAAAPNGARDELIDQYNDAVTAWTATHRAEFASLGGLTMMATTDALPLQIIPLGVNTSPDSVKDTDTSDLKTYQPLKYTSASKGTPLKLPAMHGAEVGDPGGDVKYTLTFDRTTGAGESAGTVTFDRLWRHDTWDEEDTCRRRGGYKSPYHGGHCEYVYEVVDVCVAIVTTGGSDWGVSGPGGCQYSSGVDGDGRHFSVAHYELVRANGRAVTSFSAKTVPVTVRSGDDPWVDLQRITDGTLRFGLTGAQKAVAGIVLIVLGCLFTLPSVVVIQCLRRRNSRKTVYIQNGGGYPNMQPQQTYVPLNPPQYAPPPHHQPAPPMQPYGGPGYPPQQVQQAQPYY